MTDSHSSNPVLNNAVQKLRDGRITWLMYSEGQALLAEIDRLRALEPKATRRDNEHLSWCALVAEDLAKMEGGGNTIHFRAHKAIGILFAEIERLERLAQPPRAHRFSIGDRVKVAGHPKTVIGIIERYRVSSDASDSNAWMAVDGDSMEPLSAETKNASTTGDTK